jgi:uncharacterized protein
MTPRSPSEREPILDALRGTAILGILLVNMESMRGSQWLLATAGHPLAQPRLPDRIAQFAIGWLASGKFISMLAMMFGIGAALIAARVIDAGAPARGLFVRRYTGLIAFGLVHMLVFPGDILFMYGVSGMFLLAFLMLRVSALFVWSAALVAAYSTFSLRSIALHGSETPQVSPEVPGSFQSYFDALREQTIAAYAAGSWSDIFTVHASQALWLQIAQLTALPWVLAMFLFGYAVARAGVVQNFAANGTVLRRAAFVGIALGLPANIGLGLIGPIAAFSAAPATEPIWMTRWAAFAQAIGAPVLAIGYASALALLFLRRAPFARLVAVGRMALTAYLLQSVLTLAVFAGLRLYDRLSTVSALLVVFAIWIVLLVVCPRWLRSFRLGPAEWLWRSITYGRAQPLRVG